MLRNLIKKKLYFQITYDTQLLLKDQHSLVIRLWLFGLLLLMMKVNMMWMSCHGVTFFLDEIMRTKPRSIFVLAATADSD